MKALSSGIVAFLGSAVLLWAGMASPGIAAELVPGDYPTIQAAINAASDGATILVADETYFENIDFLGKAITVRSVNGPLNCIIDGGGNGSVVTFNSGEGSGSIVDGFTIQNGTGNQTHQPSWTMGGGIFVNAASPQILNNIIKSNTAMGAANGSVGGGIFAHDSSVTIRGNVIMDNYAYHYGGGLHLEDGSPTLDGNHIDGNTSEWAGAGMFLYGAGYSITPTVTNNIVSNNSTLGDGQGGGGIIINVSNSSFEMVNNTFYNNHASSTGQGGGGVLVMNQSDVTVRNSIFWGNTAANAGPQLYLSSVSSSLIVTYSNVEGGFSGSGNINSDPMFLNPFSDDYRLSIGSPCLDAGSNSAPLPVLDFLGNPRVTDDDADAIAVVDMGAIEGAYSAPTTPIQGEIKTKIQLKFSKPSKDKIQVKVKDWQLPAGVIPTDVTVNVGGAECTGTLDAKGKHKSPDGRDSILLKQSKKTQLWKLTVKRKENDFAGDLLDDGCTNADNPKPGLPVTVPLTIEVGGTAYSQDVSLVYESKLGKKGTAK